MTQVASVCNAHRQTLPLGSMKLEHLVKESDKQLKTGNKSINVMTSSSSSLAIFRMKMEIFLALYQSITTYS